MTKIFFLPKCWYLKFQLSYDKPAVSCANEEFDLPIEKIRDHVKALNSLQKNQGLADMYKIMNDRDGKKGTNQPRDFKAIDINK